MTIDESDKYDSSYGQERSLNSGFFSRLWDQGFGLTTADNADSIYELLSVGEYGESPLGTDIPIDTNVARAVIREAFRRNDPNFEAIYAGASRLLGEAVVRKEIDNAWKESLEQGDLYVQDVVQRAIDLKVTDESTAFTAMSNHVVRTNGQASMPTPDTSTLLGQAMAELRYAPSTATPPPAVPAPTPVTTTTVEPSTTTTQPVAPSEMTVTPTSSADTAGATTTTSVPPSTATTMPSAQATWTPPATTSTMGSAQVISIDQMVRLMIESGQRDIGQQMAYMDSNQGMDQMWEQNMFPESMPSWLAGSAGQQLSYRDAADFLFSGNVSPAMMRTLQKRLAAAGYLDGEMANFESGDVTDAYSNQAWRMLLGDARVEGKDPEQILREKTAARQSAVDFTDPKLEFRLQNFAQQNIGRGLSQDEVVQFTEYLKQLQQGPMQYDITNPEVQGMYAQDYMAENMQDDIATQTIGAYVSGYDELMRQVFG